MKFLLLLALCLCESCQWSFNVTPLGFAENSLPTSSTMVVPCNSVQSFVVQSRYPETFVSHIKHDDILIWSGRSTEVGGFVEMNYASDTKTVVYLKKDIT